MGSGARSPGRSGLLRYAVLGTALAFAGPPVYIHTPALYANAHQMSLAAVGGVLLALRCLDFAQDPMLAWWIARTRVAANILAAGFGVLLAGGALMLFAPAPLFDAGWWLAVSLAAVFTGFSGLQIMYYGAGVRLAERQDMPHSLVAGWREAGVLAGITLACIAPAALGAVFGEGLGYPLFALVFCALLAVAISRMWSVWPAKLAIAHTPQKQTPRGYRELLRDPIVRLLLLIGLLNALPTGVTATLFLFFVEDRLAAPAHAGPALLLFFLAAAIAAPIWARVARAIGSRPAMLVGMGASILAFAWCLTLQAGDWPAFYVISAASGAALGADMTLLPAILSRRLAERRLDPELGFGLWGFLNKLSLALAAGLVLPFIESAGFAPGAPNDGYALSILSLAYAGVPCVLKGVAAVFLIFAPLKKEST